MRKALVACTLIIGLGYLSGCGSSRDSQEQTYLVPRGLWTSTTFDQFAMVDPNGFAVLLDGDFSPGNTPNPGLVLYRGTWWADKKTGVIDEAMIWVIDGFSSRGVDFNAIHAPRSSITGSLALPVSRNVDLRWDSLSDSTASFSKVTGTWNAPGGISGFAFTVNSDGSLTGSDNSGCTYQGRIFVERSDTNVYFVRMRQSCGQPFDPEFEGLAALLKSNTGADVLLIATSAIILLAPDHSIIEVMHR